MAKTKIVVTDRNDDDFEINGVSEFQVTPTGLMAFNVDGDLRASYNAQAWQRVIMLRDETDDTAEAKDAEISLTADEIEVLSDVLDSLRGKNDSEALAAAATKALNTHRDCRERRFTGFVGGPGTSRIYVAGTILKD